MILAFTGAGISKASGIPTFSDMPNIRIKLSRNYAKENPQDFAYTMQTMRNACLSAKPNDAHLALAEYNIPIITMNVDGLHQRAGSKIVLPIHGNIIRNKVVLYGDEAPNYSIAHNWVSKLDENDYFLIVGTSFYTGISEELKRTADASHVNVIVINEDAEHKVREFLESHQDNIGNFNEFLSRTPTWMKHFIPLPFSY